jgi:hypothetical protein
MLQLENSWQTVVLGNLQDISLPNKMHVYLINLFQLNYPLHVSNKQVYHQEELISC